jgi:DNA-binding transcriptional MocR family regulator
MCLAVVASDDETADRLALRLTPGTTWVSHILQRLTLALVTDPDVRTGIDRAGTHYAERNAAFAVALADRGLPVTVGDGLNLWVPLPVPAARVREDLMRRGWLVRDGDHFFLSPEAAGDYLRLTVHHLDDAETVSLADDLASAVAALQPSVRGGRIEG